MKPILYSACLSILILSASPVFAHTHLESKVPAENSVLTEAPSEVILEFSEGLEVAMSKLEVKNAKTGEVVSVGKPTTLPGDDKSLQVPLKPLKKEKATYTVSWKAVSKDTHKMQGSYSFKLEPK